nr:MAG TPA: hypothetical protein [Caudoviricetes sp.]
MSIFSSTKLLHILKICKVLAISFKLKYIKTTRNVHYQHIPHIVKNAKNKILIRYSFFLFTIFA